MLTQNCSSGKKIQKQTNMTTMWNNTLQGAIYISWL